MAQGSKAKSFIGNILPGISEGFTGNQASAKAATRAWKRSLYASNTSYQRGVADMKAAGLNPMLAYSQGGASQPQASASQVRPLGGEVVQAYTGLAGQKNQNAIAQATTDNMRQNTALQAAQTANTQQQVEATAAETAAKKAHAIQAPEQERLATENARQTLVNTTKQLELLGSEATSADAAARQATVMADLARKGAQLANEVQANTRDITARQAEVEKIKLEAIKKAEELARAAATPEGKQAIREGAQSFLGGLDKMMPGRDIFDKFVQKYKDDAARRHAARPHR